MKIEEPKKRGSDVSVSNVEYRRRNAAPGVARDGIATPELCGDGTNDKQHILNWITSEPRTKAGDEVLPFFALLGVCAEPLGCASDAGQPQRGVNRPALAVHTQSRVCYMHACPCGYFSDPTRECRCTGAIIQRYLSKVSGPLLDRIDLHIEVPAVAYKELRCKDTGVTSTDMRARVEAARAIQHNRGFYNARIPSRLLRNICALDDAGERTLEMAVPAHGPKRPRA